MSHARDLFNLSGKVAIVTGASRGIGAAAAHGLAMFGAKVVVSSRKQEGVDAVAAAIHAAGHEATAIAAHVGDADARRRLVEQTLTAYGGVDILVNNAATSPASGPLLQMGEAVFDKIMAVNVKGPLELAKAVAPWMAQRGSGTIVNISSISGLRPSASLGLYGATKSALISLTHVMAQEWAAQRIRANAICPGLVQTKLSSGIWQNEAALATFLSRVPLGRMAQPEELVGLVVYLASPASSYCTGAAFTADGGFLCT